ncbi:DUF1653 domain-containing protein [Mycolicibacterium sp. 120270]|uniref:DUF1653 domain-containing protein n=1 Tax=Mycolicibacterium sp. 120270 TaxID=3090600 RepID=UPI00299F02B9|nr:DUF1653 domain-containing protein [Mycolicibacterium sp. 120270]MDX1882711.1 DUF1653 domain-containing protein [Mycolicibacterium sp. 120270]
MGPTEKVVSIIYTNYRGETALRAVIPERLWYGNTDWHPADQWFLRAYDLDRKADRDFAVGDIKWWQDGMISKSDALKSQESVAIPAGVYKHFKGELYEVLDIARDSETEDEFVYYRKISDGSKWVRSLAMFSESVIREGKAVKRFQLVE